MRRRRTGTGPGADDSSSRGLRSNRRRKSSPSSSSPSSSYQVFHSRSERKMILLIIIMISAGWGHLVSSAETQEEEEEGFNAEAWLRRFGYSSQASGQMSTMHSAQISSKAVGDMQRFYGSDVTGEMDPATVQAMRRPRCGLPDRRPEESVQGTRKRRYVLTRQRWDKELLTYSIMKQRIPSSSGEKRTSDAIRRAFDVWGRVTSLAFQESPAGGGINASDISSLFASGFHGDMSLFDGEGGSSAHAYYPGPGIGGDTHFDADEPWTSDNENQEGIDLFSVAVHELGHASGSEHSENPSAMMAPFYQWMDTQNFSSHEDDIRGVQRMYGPPPVTEAPPTSPPTIDDEPTNPSPTLPSVPEEDPTPPPPTHSRTEPPEPPARPDPSPTFPLAPPTSTPTTFGPEPEPEPGPEPEPEPEPGPEPEPVTPPVRRDVPPPTRPPNDPPNICDGDFDTVTSSRGEMFVFKGRWFWRVRRNRVSDNYPMPISVFWNGLPDSIDAAYERHDGKFVFFKGDRYWSFREADVSPGYPQPLYRYGRGVPTQRIDTAIWWEPNEYTYFFSGDRYWRYNEETRTTDRDFPKPISRWGKIPPSPRGAFLSDDGASTFFYKGSTYWRFDNRRTEAAPGYPRSILKDFMGCVGVPDPKPDPDQEPDQNQEPDQDQEAAPPTQPDGGLPDGSDEDEATEVKVVVSVADSESKVMTSISVTVPSVLISCISVSIYAILRTSQDKEPPRALVHCRRSSQDWV